MEQRGDQELQNAIQMFQTKYDSLIELMVSMQNFEEIVKYIIKLLDEFDKFKNDQLVFTVKKKEIEEMIESIKKLLYEKIEDLCNLDFISVFLMFAYELRK